MVNVTAAGKRALNLLRVDPLKRNREGWVTPGGQFVALNTVAKLRKSGLCRLSSDRRVAHPTERGLTLTPDHVASLAIEALPSSPVEQCNPPCPPHLCIEWSRQGMCNYKGRSDG